MTFSRTVAFAIGVAVSTWGGAVVAQQYGGVTPPPPPPTTTAVPSTTPAPGTTMATPATPGSSVATPPSVPTPTAPQPPPPAPSTVTAPPAANPTPVAPTVPPPPAANPTAPAAPATVPAAPAAPVPTPSQTSPGSSAPSSPGTSASPGMSSVRPIDPFSDDGLVDPFADPPISRSSDGLLASSDGTSPVGTTSAGGGRSAPTGHRSGRPYSYQGQDIPLGVGLLVGGGVVDFTRSDLRNVTDTGGSWDARLIFGTREVLALEAAYIGSVRNMTGMGLGPDTLLVSNGAEGLMRLNIPIIDGPSVVEPFGFAGIGWSRYEISTTAPSLAMRVTQDDVLEIPYGVGLSIGYGGLLLDGRFTYRATYYSDLIHTANGNASLDNWSLTGHLGFEF
jgi:hypothetical protein